MKVALAHDYLTQRGGAERVALQFARLFPGSSTYTSVYSPDRTFSEFKGQDIRTSWLQLISPFRSDPRLAAPLLPHAWNKLKVDDSDVVLCSSTGWSHGISVAPGIRKVVYCHNPARWLYQTDEYMRSEFGRVMVRCARPYLTAWDKTSAATADVYIANSSVVAERIRVTYGRDSQVIHPPMMLSIDGPQTEITGIDPGFFLTIARGRSYKNTDVVEAAVASLPEHQLVVAGTNTVGRSATYSNVHHVGFVSEAELRWLYANTSALISVAHEDFGLTPIEANAFGAPAAVLGSGGFLDTVIDGVNGVHIAEPEPGAIVEALSRLPSFDIERLRRHVSKFSVEAFYNNIRSVIDPVADVS